MKRFSRLAFLVFVLYAATIFAASYHHHHTNSNHLTCKLCQFDSQSADPTPTAKAISATDDSDLIEGIEFHAFIGEIARLTFSRAPPTVTL